jgi:hypothetical protein
MGTSTPYGGPGGGNPLVPTWLEPDSGEEFPVAPEGVPNDSSTPPDVIRPSSDPLLALGTIPQGLPAPARFTAPRNNFTRFVSSGGTDRPSLGRAVSGYVSNVTDGARHAARRMGSSRAAGARLLGFLVDAQARGAHEALRALNLEQLAGRPIEEVFLGLADYICPQVGTIDEGISRDAFIETIVDLVQLGVTDLDALTADQMQTVFELFATHAIEARLCNDIGKKLITLPSDARTAASVQAQLRDFVRRGVSDALTAARAAFNALTPDRALGFVRSVYQTAFEILEIMGEREAAA